MPFALFANVACYLGALVVVEQSRATHTAQLDDWRIAAVVLLICWQASWLHFLQRQALGTFLGSLILWWCAILLGGFAPLAVQPGVLLATFSYAAERTGAIRTAILTFGVAATAMVFVAADALYATPGTPPWHTPAVQIAWLIAAVGLVAIPAVLGAWYAELRDRSERIVTLAHHVASGEVIRTAEAVSAERRTLAQELHDTSSAHLAALLALSTAARATAAQTTAATGEATVGRLVEQIRNEGERLYLAFEQLLTRMRHEDRTATDSHRPGHGQHTVAELPDLAGDHRRDTGVALTLHYDPSLTEIDQRLGPMRSHIAYRVMQEALSNARKHAPGAAITITVEDDAASLLLCIENEAVPEDGPSVTQISAARPLSLGYGLEGMRDRLQAAGGNLRTGPRHAGGWRVNALLPHPPYRDAPSSPGKQPGGPSTSEHPAS